MKKSCFVRFCIMQAAYWSFYAALPGYLSAYLLSAGISASILGMLLSVNMLACLIGSLFWGRWIDRHNSSKQFFIAGNVLALVLASLIYLFAGQIPLLFMLYPLYGFMMGPIATTLDAWVIASFPERANAVSNSRSFATAGYAIITLVMGQLVIRTGYQTMLYLALLFIAVSVITALTQKNPSFSSKDLHVQQTSVSPQALLHSRTFLLLLISVFFTGMAIAPINNMKAVIFDQLGCDVSYLGWDGFIGCMIQIPFLVLVPHLKGISSEKRLMIGSFAALCYAALVMIARNPAMVILGTIMNNVSFGILFPTMREITEKNVRPELRYTAHSLIDVGYGSLSGMIATAWGGNVLEIAGISTMAGICVLMEFAALFFCVLLMFPGFFRKPRRPITRGLSVQH